jgi:HAMP domain-containing protein
MDLLVLFRGDRGLKSLTREGSIGGKRLLLSAAPKISKPGCIRCHGKRMDAPQQIRDQFPGDRGYNYQVDQVVGVSLVGVPMANVQALALQRTGIVLVVLTVLFGLILFAVNRLVKRGLLGPILEITQAAHAISHGRLDEQVVMDRDDEIGELARSVELVRRSFAKLIKRMRKH